MPRRLWRRRDFLAGMGLTVVGAHVLTAGSVRRMLAPGDLRSIDTLGSNGAVVSHVPAPAIITRAEWGADETLGNRTRSFWPLVKAVVHHTAIEEGDPMAQIRGILEYHTQHNGWSDIGYNFVVDREGRIYEGRWARDYADGEVHDGEDGNGNLVEGAHALSHNPGALGIAVMGDYTADALTAASMDAVAKLIAWKFSIHDVNPYGNDPYTTPDGTVETFPNICGHQDVNPGTSCPGGHIHDRLPELRAAVAADMVAITRFAGGDRYETAALLSTQQLASPATRVFVASGASFADALAAAPTAMVNNAPLLLTAPDSVPVAVARLLGQLKPDQISVVGGPTAVSDGVLSTLRQYASTTVDRIQGADRYATAAELARAGGFSKGGVVAIASGTTFADALAAAPTAALLSAPMLLVDPGSVPPPTAQILQELSPSEIRVFGGPTAVSDAALQQLQSYAGNVHRVAGDDRYATATAISQAQYPNGTATVYLASGSSPSDALAAGPAAARANAPLLLVNRTSIPASTAAELKRLRPSGVVIIGGTSAIGSSIESSIRNILTT